MVVLLTGCGKHKGAQMDSPLTEAAAREQINTYLLDTLEALPPGVGLSRTPDNPNLGTLGTGAANTVPCEDDNSNPDGPVQAQTSYWVVGVPRGQNDHYFQLIRDYWTGRGFHLHPGSDSRWAAVMTPDQYRLNVQDAGKGDGSLSIGAGSPCFPKAAKGTATPQPPELTRPS
ncbi:hypothetical protein [Nocardia terpenica]|uniref:Uncharacterized protein n=1 Tax=Nocardia terpenica TaxID=455432 RepID=A0A164JJ08_9NOCA|nr:hypothetical protein [Nocardia terpenica]KZM70450.1 hypothetical protein AWN90_04015 [Nocardia terpenica]NQE91137.1 hypothetical protein [Nocardia terpenica]